jgi:hypothetical protein
MLVAPPAGVELQVVDGRLVVSGQIKPGDEFAVLSVLVKHGKTIEVVHFSAITGGEADASLRIGRLIRARRLHTIASGACLSGCTVAFLGGITRSFAVDPGFAVSLLGLHGANDSGSPGTATPRTAEADARLRDYIAEMTGGRPDPQLIERILRLRGQNQAILFFDPWLATRAVALARATVFECLRSDSTPDLDLYLSRCEEIPGIDALQQGLITTTERYRIGRSDPVVPDLSVQVALSAPGSFVDGPTAIDVVTRVSALARTIGISAPRFSASTSPVIASAEIASRVQFVR